MSLEFADGLALVHCDVRGATHLKVNGHWHKIIEKWGVTTDGWLLPPSKGGFGCVLKDGRKISMWDAEAYGKI